ncbi:hypothetical protein FG379_002812 [Cryptosporidium bovis]|uniref:uncharacterized protein n=1 Tax=Cryptosporidium bovis TaxID=310047 RepID=UPI003519DAB6|nr:hypothetical protein FG379_002812 [Cryptosporidium bovis]
MGDRIGFVCFLSLYFGILVFIGFSFSLSDETHDLLEKNQKISNEDQAEVTKSDSIEVVESQARFPTLGSFFEWLNTFSEKKSDFESKNEYLSTFLPVTSDLETHMAGITVVSGMVNCLELLERVCNLYKMSTSESTSHFFSENAGLSMEGLLQCFLDLKTIAVNSYLKLYSFLDQSYDSLPIIGQITELVLSIYYNSWDVIKVISAYKSILINITEQSQNKIDQCKRKIASLESYAGTDPLKQLEKNIETQEVKYNERKLKLGELILALFKGDFSLSSGISELELIITHQVDEIVAELKDSIKVIEDSNRKMSPQSDKYKTNLDLISTLKTELNIKEEVLITLKNGPVTYCPKFDAELESTYSTLVASISGITASTSGSASSPTSDADADTEAEETESS